MHVWVGTSGMAGKGWFAALPLILRLRLKNETLVSISCLELRHLCARISCVWLVLWCCHDALHCQLARILHNDVGRRVCLTMNTRPTYIKEQPYGTTINYVAVRRPAGGDRAVVPVPCYLASQRRMGRVSRAGVRPMWRINLLSLLLKILSCIFNQQVTLATQYREIIARRRKADRPERIASRGTRERWYRCSM